MSKRTALPSSTFKFLKDLGNNNNRPWFQEHKGRYTSAHESFKELAANLMDEMSKIDEIEEMKLYRIYKDVRFSKDKSPYKTSFSGGFKRATKWLRGGYYFHFEPGNTFVGGGFWAPNPADLKRVRKEIEVDDKPLRKIIKAASFKKYFGELEGDKVKTAPRGFDKEHPAIDLIRHKQFLVTHRFTNKQATSPGITKEMAKAFKAMRPFFNYMSEVLTTDENGVPIE